MFKLNFHIFLLLHLKFVQKYVNWSGLLKSEMVTLSTGLQRATYWWKVPCIPYLTVVSISLPCAWLFHPFAISIFLVSLLAHSLVPAVLLLPSSHSPASATSSKHTGWEEPERRDLHFQAPPSQEEVVVVVMTIKVEWRKIKGGDSKIWMLLHQMVCLGLSLLLYHIVKNMKLQLAFFN